MTWRAGLLLWCALLVPSAAHAKCLGPALQLLWSYPQQGATDVPTNAVFWVIAPWTWRSPVMTLDGLPLQVSTPSGGTGTATVAPGPLEPNHDYVLRVDYSARLQGEDAGSPSSFEIAFRTGAEAAVALPAVTVEGHTKSSDLSAASCTEFINARDCYDVGPLTLVSAQVDQPRAIAWLVDGHLWPANCGMPAVYQHVSGRDPCFELRAIGPGGLSTDAVRHCVTEEPRADAAPPPADASGASESDARVTPPAATQASKNEGCALASHSAQGSAACALLLSLLLQRARRRRSNFG